MLDGTGPPPLKRFRIRQKGPAPWAVAGQPHPAVPEPQDASAEVAPNEKSNGLTRACAAVSHETMKKVIDLILKT